MTALGLILRSLRYHWRMNLAVACGVGVGAAVLTGALLVGDSMRGSLRQLTLDRLGRIDEALVADRFFRQELAGELAGSERPGATAGSSSSAESTGGQATRGTHQEQVRPPILSDGGPPDAGHGAIAVAPAILLRASLEKADSQPPVRANQVNLVGCDERFWQLGHGGPRRRPRPNEIVLNAPLAQCLAVAEGDAVVLRLPRPGAIPAESVLGRKQQTVRSLRLRVREVLPAEGLGKFGLRPTQRLPRNAYVSLGEIQEQLAQPGRINAILVAGRAKWQTADGGNPPAADYGIHVEQTPRGYVNIWSERMLLEPAAETAMLEALAGAACQPALTYLANSIACGGRSIPYSTVTALDFAAGPPLGPMLSPEGRPVPPLADDQIALNTWAADDLGAKLGDQIDLSYFEPESAHGVPQEKTVRLRLAAVVQLAGAAADPALTPAVPGITDRLSLSGWDPPFPFDARRVRPKDDRYWHDHRATPKAFVSLATGRRLWASRFGQSTSLRVGDCPNFRPPVPSDRPKMGLSPSTVETFKDRLRIDPAAMGLVFQPVKQQGLDAAAGTTPFGVLFLLFSSFVIAAAAMLMAILFRLGVDGRAAEAGILLALGFRPRKVAGLLTAEGLLVAALGSLLGMGAGIGYAALMLAGLRTWWLAAVSTPLLRLYVEPLSLAIGPAAAAAIAAITMFFSARRVSRVPPRRLLAGVVASAIDGRRTTDDGRRARALPSVVRPPSSVPSGQSPVARRPSPRHPSTRPIVVDALLLGVALAPAVLLLAVPLGEEARVGAFFGAGALALGALLGLAYRRLRAGATGPAVAPGRGNLLRMALRGAARNPGRSTLSAGLTAAACFLIVATSAFRLDPASQARHGTSGSGGFALVAESDQPIYHDLGTPAGRAELGFSRADERLLAACMVFAFRVKPGDDASCLNLYQPRQPRLLGLPRPFLEQAVFAWADRPPGKENPWLALESINGQGPDAQDAETRRRGDAGTRRQADKQTRRQGDKESSDVSLVPASPRLRVPASSSPPATSHQPLATSDQPGAVPVVLDKNTANYSLHLMQGRGENFSVTDSRGQTLRLAVAGLLANSIFQGDLLVSQESLLRYDPTIGGYRFFLIDAPAERSAAVERALERTLDDYGFTAQPASERLAGFLAVENTYLSAFQSLGGLGLLLGTIGLAAVQLRNVLERRGELALLRAAGFRRQLLARLVVLENLVLLVAGLAIGCLAAVLALLPHLAGGGASVPWGPLAGLLVLVLAVGLAASVAAVRAVARAPLLPALRHERI